MAISTEERLQNVHARAMKRFDAIQGAVYDERKQALEDRRFYSIAGAQWEGPLGEQFVNRAKFEFNKVHLAVIRIINEYRNNRVSVLFEPKDGTNDDKMADTCAGLYRADEQASNANEAYDNAFEEAVGGGMGAWRYRADYEDEDDDDNDRQRVCIEPIFDADSCVFFDLDAKRKDKKDSTHAFVLNGMTPSAVMEEWDEDTSTWPKTITQSQFDWCTSEIVYIAEYYEIEQKSELIRYFRGLDDNAPEMRVSQRELDADPEMLNELETTGFTESRQKKIKRRVCHKYLISGTKVMEDCGIIAGKNIPVVVTYGKRWVVDGVERLMGHVRLAKDAQRLINSLMTWLAEIAGRFNMEKPIFDPEQVSQHAEMWANDNIENFPYLLANAIKDAQGNIVQNGPVGYTKAPNVPPAMGALLQIAEQSLSDLLGNQQAGEQMQPNLSGKAVELIQNRLDMQVFIYMSNFGDAVKRGGEIWLSMQRDIAVTESRKVKVIDAAGEASSATLNVPMVNEDGEDYLDNDMSKASFDVVSEVGPSSSSRRSATVRALTGIATITQDPETSLALTLATIVNIEGEGLTDLRDWARAKAVRMGVVKPTDDEKEELQGEQANQQPDPQAQYLQAAAEQAVADAANKRADTIESLANADLKRAQTKKTIAETVGTAQDTEINASEALARVATSPGQSVL